MTTAPRNPPTAADRETAAKLAAAVEAAMPTPTLYRDDTPLPVTGTAPPVAQPGVPPMSQRTTDTLRAVMFASVATVPPGLIAIGILVASEHANPTVIGMICAAPAVIALALARLVRSAGKAVPPVVHQHYTGTVNQHTKNVNSHTRWLGKTTNNL